MLLVHDKDPFEILHSDRVKSRNDDFTIANLVINDILGSSVGPISPFLLFLIETIIIDEAINWEFVLVVLTH
jgi:hypothetical protein